jgi:hypothetical protein
MRFYDITCFCVLKSAFLFLSIIKKNKLELSCPSAGMSECQSGRRDLTSVPKDAQFRIALFFWIFGVGQFNGRTDITLFFAVYSLPRYLLFSSLIWFFRSLFIPTFDVYQKGLAHTFLHMILFKYCQSTHLILKYRKVIFTLSIWWKNI